MSVTFEVQERIARVALDRPAKMNAINQAMRAQLKDIFARIDEDDEVKVVVLEGAGGRAFSAGADIQEAGTRTAFERRRGIAIDPAHVVRRCSKPVIGLIRGYALGGGLELAAACDIRIASDTAVFGFPEIIHGWLPAGGGGTQQVPRLIGTGWAMKLILTGDRIDAHKAREIGLVEEVYPDAIVEEQTLALARRIAEHRLRAIILAKAAVRLTEQTSLDAGLAYEKELTTVTYYFEDRQEAIRAFQEKRAPRLGD